MLGKAFRKISKWHDYTKEKPEINSDVIAYYSEWICNSNPTGMRIGFRSKHEMFGFVSAAWYSEKDDYVTDCLGMSEHSDPEYWIELPELDLK